MNTERSINLQFIGDCVTLENNESFNAAIDDWMAGSWSAEAAWLREFHGRIEEIDV
jgi:hypothetical protein